MSIGRDPRGGVGEWGAHGSPHGWSGSGADTACGGQGAPSPVPPAPTPAPVGSRALLRGTSGGSGLCGGPTPHPCVAPGCAKYGCHTTVPEKPSRRVQRGLGGYPGMRPMAPYLHAADDGVVHPARVSQRWALHQDLHRLDGAGWAEVIHGHLGEHQGPTAILAGQGKGCPRSPPHGQKGWDGDSMLGPKTAAIPSIPAPCTALQAGTSLRVTCCPLPAPQ